MLSESQGDWFNLPWLTMTQYHQSKLQSCSLPAFLCPFRHSLTSVKAGPQSELQEDNKSVTIPFQGVERIKCVQSLRISHKTWNTSQPLDHLGSNLLESMKCAVRYHIHLLTTKLGGIFLPSSYASEPRAGERSQDSLYSGSFFASRLQDRAGSSKAGLVFFPPLRSESLHTAFVGWL